MGMRAIKEANRSSILNRAITIMAEESGDEGAPARYSIRVDLPAGVSIATLTVELPFQRGPVGADGSNVNGISDEALIEILVHRLRAFQAGKLACDTNAAALSHLEQALAALEHRTAQRRAAGVEGTTNVITEEKGHTG
jgi:hypothetical protein